MVGFPTWAALLSYLEGQSPDLEVRWVWYAAPLDTRARLVKVVKRYKNGKLRIDPMSSDADPFTADVEHLSRFFRVVDAPDFPRAELEVP